MDGLIEVIVPTFINCHLFWIIPKKNLLLRSAMNRILKSNHKERITDPEKYCKQEMVAVYIDDLWARAVINQINIISRDEKQFVCWLPDYGVVHVVSRIFHLPEDMKKCPHLARQASLDDVVNLMTDLRLGQTGYEFKFKKTLNYIEGVRKVAWDCIEASEKIFFSVMREDEFNIYGDIIFSDKNNKQQSLTDFLIKKKTIGIDRNMFNSMEASRQHFKEAYLSCSQNWYQKLDRTETKHLKEIIFNEEVNTTLPAMEFFKRKHFNDNIANRYS